MLAFSAPSLLAADDSPRSNFASFSVPGWVWVALVVAIVAFLLIDVLIIHGKPHEISFKEAMIESAVWIALGLSFGLIVLFWQGGQAAGEYYAGYLIEKSLSIDNVFVWAVILSYFSVPKMYQFRVLFWGVFGALVLRAIFIFAGVALVERFDWVLYIFGAFLLYSAYKLVSHRDAEVHPENNPVLKLIQRFVPSTTEFHGQKLFVRAGDESAPTDSGEVDHARPGGKAIRAGQLVATPLFAVLVLIEVTDVVFAVDSVPAILAVSREPFIVFASNAFAIMGLRALYFALAGMKDRFRYLDLGLAAILAFVGIKMLLVQFFHFPIPVSLGVIFGILAISIWLSLRADRADRVPAEVAGQTGEVPLSGDEDATGVDSR